MRACVCVYMDACVHVSVRACVRAVCLCTYRPFETILTCKHDAANEVCSLQGGGGEFGRYTGLMKSHGSDWVFKSSSSSNTLAL